MRPRLEVPYNPLDKPHLAESVVAALLGRDLEPLPPDVTFLGAGIYAIYYTGDFPAYSPIAAQNRRGRYAQPIYVGKATPPGGRRGGIGEGPVESATIYGRLRQHAASIEQAGNLDLTDFACRYLVLDDVWISLGENLLIERFRPLWNVVVDGFGNHTPGRGRLGQRRSAWDVLHPGRAWAQLVQPHGLTEAALRDRIAAFLDPPAPVEPQRRPPRPTTLPLFAQDNGGVV
ncbi:MAG: hypothetical protein QOF51_2253 [Chloroflexota bacterium]|jgi:hypothetical protein|nr:hypothetical protein [Chloroflexota bacterium]